MMEDAREQVAAAIGAAAREIVFTSGATEANNLALTGSGRARRLVSAIEHDSLRAASALELIPVNAAGVVDLAALEALLAADSRPALVSLMLANNETGVMQPVAEAAASAHAPRRAASLRCGSGRWAGCRSMWAPSASICSACPAIRSAGPRASARSMSGAASIWRPPLRGGGQERGRRAGTENLAGIAGFGAAAAIAAGELEDMRRVAGLRDALEAAIHAARPEALIFGRDAARLPNTTCVALAGRAGGDPGDGARSRRRDGQRRCRLLLRQGASPRRCCAPWACRRRSRARRSGSAWAGASEAGDIDRFIDAWSGISVKESATRELAA